MYISLKQNYICFPIKKLRLSRKLNKREWKRQNCYTMHTFLNLLKIFLVAYEITISHCEQNNWYSFPLLWTLLHVCPFVNTVMSHLRFVFGSCGPEHDSTDNLNGEDLTSRNFKWENKIKENWMYEVLVLCFLLKNIDI